jgi:hypothetical protein
MTSIFLRVAVLLCILSMYTNVSAQDDAPPQYILDLKSVLTRIDAAWARGDSQFIKKESAAYREKNGQDVGAISLDMFVAYYCERDWEKADKLQKEILNLCKRSAQREAVGEVLHDTCNIPEWRKVAEDDQMYAKAIATLKRVFRDRFPGSESALIVEVTFYRTSK